MKIGQVGIKIALGLMLLIFLVPAPGFATCGLFDFHIQFGSTPKKKPEKKPPTLTLSPEMRGEGSPQIVIRDEVYTHETPHDNG